MKYATSLNWDPELHAAAAAYAEKKGISLSRLVHEMLCQGLGLAGELNPELQAKIEERIARHPGRAPLTVEEKRRRALEKVQQKYPGARLAEPNAQDEEE